MTALAMGVAHARSEGFERPLQVQRRATHAARPGFRIAELQIGPTQKVPGHYHSNVHDTFYVLAGSIRIFLQDPKEEVRLTPGQTYAVPPRRPHLVTNAGNASVVFLILQGIGEYDFVPLNGPARGLPLRVKNIAAAGAAGSTQIVLQKSFCTGDQKFCGLQARLSCKDVRDLIAGR